MSVHVTPRQFLVDRNGAPQAVVLSFLDYRKLVKMLDDRDDARTLKSAIRTRHGVITHAELVKRLKRK